MAAALILTPAAHSANVTWSSVGSATPGGDGNWNGGSTWWTGSANQTWTSGDNATFSAAGNTTVNSNATAGTLTFSSGTDSISLLAGAGNLTVNSGITATNSANTTALTNTISANLTLGANQTWTVNNGGTVGTTSLVASGPIRGAFGITKAGNGTLVLAGNNTFTGGVSHISGGTIIATNSGALGTGTKTIVMNTGGTSTFKLDGSGGDINFANTITFQTSGLQAGGAIVNIAGNNTISGPITLNSGSTGTAIQVDGGTLTLAGNILVGAGTRSLALQGAGNGTATGVISANGGVFKSGAGVWTLTGANTYSSGTTINVSGGTLVANRSNNTLNPTTSALGNPQASQNITVSSGGTLKFNLGDTLGGATSTPVATIIIQNGGTVTNNGTNFTTLGPLILNGGTLTGTGGAAAGFQMFGFSRNITASNNATSTISGSGTNAGYHLNTNTFFQVDAGSTLNISGDLIDRNTSLGGSGGFTKTGGGTMSLVGTNTYTGTTAITAGTLLLAHATTLVSATGAVNVSGGTLSTNLASATLGGNLTLSSSGSLSANSTGVGTFNLSSGKTFSMSGGTWVLSIADPVTFDKIIATGSPAFTITGGMIDLSGSALSAGGYQVLSGFGSGSVSGLGYTGYDTELWTVSLDTAGLLNVAAIPEPGTWILLGIGLAFLLSRKPRRRFEP